MPTPPRLRTYARRALAVAALALAAGACRDEPAAPDAGAVRLSINASVAPAGEALQVTVRWYSTENESFNEHLLVDRRFSLGATQTALPISFSLAPCLASDARERSQSQEGPPANVCVLHVTLALLDGAGVVIDRQSVVPVDATPGTTASTADVALGLRTPFTQVVASEYRVCGLVASGNAYCAGFNPSGELGAGTAGGSSSTLVRVQGGPWSSLITSSFTTSCALKSGGAAYCWGDNNYGQLGVPASGAICPDGGLGGSCSATPVAVSGGLAFTQLSAGFSTTCGLATGGRAYCWGTNTVAGELGGGPRQALNQTFPAPQPVGGQQLFTRIAVGVDHSCAIGTDGHAYCWGYNGYGEIGVAPDTSKSCLKSLSTAPPQYDCRDVPTAVSGTQTFTTVGVGEGFSCALVADGTAYCWGDGASFLGRGTTDNAAHPTPAPVAGTAKFTQLAVGQSTACGVTAAGRVYCWGIIPFAGQTDPTLPQPLDDPHTFAAVTVGIIDACATDTRGGVFCWGGNVYGEFGNGTTERAPAPVSLGLPAGVTPSRTPAVAGTLKTR